MQITVLFGYPWKVGFYNYKISALSKLFHFDKVVTRSIFMTATTLPKFQTLAKGFFLSNFKWVACYFNYFKIFIYTCKLLYLKNKNALYFTLMKNTNYLLPDFQYLYFSKF